MRGFFSLGFDTVGSIPKQYFNTSKVIINNAKSTIAIITMYAIDFENSFNAVIRPGAISQYRPE